MPLLLEFTAKGIYCPPANVYIDPWRQVERAIITHAHSDHAYRGHGSYLAHHTSASILRLRLGEDIRLETVDFNEPVHINGVTFSLHPAGHIYGSAQIRVEHQGEVWVASGDYKTEPDGISQPFEPVRCHTFITESTFGLPVYQWKPQAEIFGEVNAWWRNNQVQDKVSILFGYSLGKAQRILSNVDTGIGRIFVHDAIWKTTEALRRDGATLPKVTRISRELDKSVYRGGLVLAPASAMATPWIRKFQPYETAAASGWMILRGAKRRRTLDRGFVLSDHADWRGLNQAVAATGAEKVFVTHGYKSAFARYLNEKGLDAYEANTLFEGEPMHTPVTEEKTES